MVVLRNVMYITKYVNTVFETRKLSGMPDNIQLLFNFDQLFITRCCFQEKFMVCLKGTNELCFIFRLEHLATAVGVEWTSSINIHTI